jgi:hypothetical protein
MRVAVPPWALEPLLVGDGPIPQPHCSFDGLIFGMNAAFGYGDGAVAGQTIEPEHLLLGLLREEANLFR